MMTTSEFEVILDSLTQEEFLEFADVIEKLADKNDAAVLDAYYEFKRNDVTRAVVKMFENDPLHKAMEAGLLWGDMDAPAPRIPETPALPEEDHDWIMPRMVLRKDIYNNFPVIVRQVNTQDGREVYAVEWHRDKFASQRDACENYCDYDDFEETQKRRLRKSLRSSRNWTVEKGHANELYRIVMIAEEILIAPKPVPAPTPAVDAEGWQEVGKGGKATAPYAGPRLTRLTDIKRHFPTVFWNKVATTSCSTYNIGLLRKTADLNKTKARLLDALSHSTFWKVVTYQDNDHCCRIVMNMHK